MAREGAAGAASDAAALHCFTIIQNQQQLCARQGCNDVLSSFPFVDAHAETEILSAAKADY
jgi:hypothetical protein